MDVDILELIFKNAQENSSKNLSYADVEKIVEDTENKLGTELTGYGKQDRPYRQFFDKKVLEADFPHQRISVVALEKANSIRNNIAYRCEKKVTFGELVDKSLSFAYSLKERFNVKKGDIIVMCSPSVPEAIYAFFAANLIGATIRPIDPMSDNNAITECLRESNSRHLIALGLSYNQMKNIDYDQLEHIVYLPMSGSLPFVPFAKKSIVNLLDKVSLLKIRNDKSGKWISFEEAISPYVDMKFTINEIAEPYEANENAAIFPTSGSTGKSKGVVTTNENFLSSAYKQLYSEFDIDDNDSMFNPMPPSSSYFWYDIVLAIVWGVTTSLSPMFNPKKCVEEFLKDESSVILLGPLLLQRICEYVEQCEKKGKSVDFSGKRHLISGGDFLEIGLEQKTNSVMKKCGSSAIVENALGTSETCGPALNPNGVLKNKNTYSVGSVGVVFPGNDMAIFEYDEENSMRDIGKEDYDLGLMYYEIGEICYLATNPNVFKEYYKDEQSTSEAIITHNDGTVWYHTGDLGYLDPSGHVFFAGRKSGLIVREGHKVWTPKIEGVIKKVPGIKDCAVIGVPDDKEKEVPACFVVYDDDTSVESKRKIEAQVFGTILSNLDRNHLPAFYHELDTIPRNLMMKEKIGELTEIYRNVSQQSINEHKGAKVFFKKHLTSKAGEQ